MKKFLRPRYSSKHSLEYSSVPSIEGSATICPSRGGLSLAWQNFRTAHMPSLLWLTLIPMRIPHSEYLFDTESMTITLSSIPSRQSAER